MPKVLGIDLGTTNSVMAIMEAGEPTVIENAEGGRLTLRRSIKHRARTAPLRLGRGALGLAELGAELVQAVRELEGELDAGPVDATLFDQVLDLAKALDVLGRVESKLAAQSGGLQKADSLVLPQRARVHLDEPRRDANYVQSLPVPHALPPLAYHPRGPWAADAPPSLDRKAGSPRRLSGWTVTRCFHTREYTT